MELTTGGTGHVEEQSKNLGNNLCLTIWINCQYTNHFNRHIVHMCDFSPQSIHNIIAQSRKAQSIPPNWHQIHYNINHNTHNKCTHRHRKKSTYKRWLVCLTPNTQIKAARQCTAMDSQILQRRRSWHRCSPVFSVLCYSVQSSHICVDAKSGSVGNR